MKFPCLVRKKCCNTAVHIVLYDEKTDENGMPFIVLDSEFLCNYQDCAKTVLTQQQKKIEVNGKILIPDDIVPDCPTISGGFVEIFGNRREIAKGTKARNPDGTVNFTEIEVI